MAALVAGLVSDIASLWILVLVLVVLILALLFRKPVIARIEKGGVKVQRGDVSIELEGEAPALEPPAAKLGEAEDVAEAEPEAPPLHVPEPVEGDDKPIEEATENGVPNWMTIIGLVSSGDVEEATSKFEELQQAEAEEESQHRNRVFWLFTRYRWGHEHAALQELAQLAEEGPLPGIAAIWQGEAHIEDGYPEKALQAFERALVSVKASRDRATANAGVARSLEALGQHQEAIARLMAALASASTHAERLTYYDRLAEIYKHESDWFRRALALEKSVELAPVSASRRFNTGYAYAQAEEYDVAAVHYEATLDLDSDHHTAANNLGVSYEHLDFPINSIRLYTRAADGGETLAMANLALRHLNEGLVEEAREILTSAMSSEDPHPNVATHLASIDAKTQAERERLEAVRETAMKRQLFLLDWATSYFVEAPDPQIGDEWKSVEGGVYQIVQEGTSFTATTKNVGPDEKRIEYRGDITNRALEGDVWREEYSLTVQGPAFTKKGTFRGFVRPETTIRLAANEGGAERYVTLNRVSADSLRDDAREPSSS